MVESLPKQRIEKLAADMEALTDAHRTGMAYFDERTGIPPQFADLKPRSIKVFGSDVAIRLSGCFDDKAMIFLFDTGERQWVDLDRGEAKESKELAVGPVAPPRLESGRWAADGASPNALTRS